MTNKNYEEEALFLNEVLPSDEWQNSTLTVDKIAALTAQYVAVLSNAEIQEINEILKTDAEILVYESEVRAMSQKGGQDNREKMMTALKKALFRKYIIVVNKAIQYFK